MIYYKETVLVILICSKYRGNCLIRHNMGIHNLVGFDRMFCSYCTDFQMLFMQDQDYFNGYTLFFSFQRLLPNQSTTR